MRAVLRALPWARDRRAATRDETGAVAVLAAALALVLLVSAAFAVDLGRQRVVRADMQALADVVALDAARVLDGRPASRVLAPLPTDGLPSLSAAVSASVARNGSSLGEGVSVTPTLVFLTTDANGAVVPERVGTALKPVPPGAVPDAVLIEAVGSVDFGFARVIGVESGSARRTAIADAQPVACLAVGSYAAGLDTGQSVLLNALLGRLLGSSVNLSAAGYQGLAATEISLLELLEGLPLVDVDTLTVADADQVLATEVSVATILGAAVTALSNADEEVSANVLADLGALAAQIGVAVDLGLLDDLALGTLLGITQGGQTALTTSVNLLDLVVAAVEVANGQYAVEVPDLAVSTGALPGGLGALLPAVDVTGTVGVLPRPRRGCGPRGLKVRTGAVDVDLGVAADVNAGTVGGLLGSNPLANLRIDPVGVNVAVSAAESTATLVDIKCGTAAGLADAEGIDVSVASSLAAATVGLAPVRVRTDVLSILPGAPAASLDLSVSLAGPVQTMQPPWTPVQQFRTPPQSYGDALRFGSGDLVSGLVPSSLALRVNGSISVFGFPAIAVTDGAVDLAGFGPLSREVLEPLLSAILTFVTGRLLPVLVTAVVNPALQLVNWLVGDILGPTLGLTVAGADVFPLPRPSCNSVALRG